jgi:hypothetical protein
MNLNFLENKGNPIFSVREISLMTELDSEIIRRILRRCQKYGVVTKMTTKINSFQPTEKIDFWRIDDKKFFLSEVKRRLA